MACDGGYPVEEDGPMEELAELQIKEEARLEKLFAEQRSEQGLDNDVTLNTFFKLFDMWIQLYRLNKCMEVLEEVVPICRKRGGDLHIKGVQALAFTLWKKSQFKDSIKLFHEIEDLIGSSAALCENMGHTYSSMGNYDEAAKYFQRALRCLDEEEKLGKKTGDRAGILLGLGLIEDRLGRFEEALASVRESQDLFRQRANGKPSSLVAKAGMSIAKILLKLALQETDSSKKQQMEEEAVEREQENVVLFEVTCGEDSPLTASALRGLGEALKRRGKIEEAVGSFARSYYIEAQKDAFDLLSIMEVHSLLFGAHMEMVKLGRPLNRASFRSYLPTVEIALQRVRNMPQDANAGAYYKVAGEFAAFAEDYLQASGLLKEALDLFKTERDEKVEGLIKHCEELKDLQDSFALNFADFSVMEAVHVERSKLVQRQKQQRQELEKKIKKLKGALKESAQKDLEALEQQHEADLASFDGKGGEGKDAIKKDGEDKDISTSAPSQDMKKFRDRNWSGLSKKELEEECTARGLGKKGSKEDLVQKLIVFQQELASKVASEAKESGKGGYTSSGVQAAEEAVIVQDDEEDDEEEDDEEEEEEDDDDDEDEDGEQVDREEMERQGKREKAIQKAIQFLLKQKCQDGFPLNELVSKLEMVNVKGFAPEKLGYKTLEKFVRGQPEAVLRYRKQDQMVLPPKK
ncbi:Inorganic diphosphatase [Durusdinium trenchii]|uniref:Inorganic diphosphatase n=2 Tax=Durusdinium trenchii TaxID=1381693 RepID=A0ABP0JDS1_9DINO